MYGWLAIVGGGVLIWAYIANRNSANSAASQSGTANSSEVPYFINQDYNTVTPPSSPTPVTAQPPPVDHDTRKGPPPVSRVHRSKAVQHKIHQIHQIHEKNADKGKKKTTAKKPPGRKVPHHPARKG